MRLLAIRGVLAADDVAPNVGGCQLRDGVKHLDLLVPDRLGLEGNRRLHGDKGEHLEHVVLHDVAQSAGLLEVRTAAAYALHLRHVHLDVVDVLAVPDRLEDAVREPERQDVLYGLLTEIVVDPIDLRLPEALAQLRIQTSRTVEVVAERLFHDHATPAVALAGQVTCGEMAAHRPEERRGYREVEEVVRRDAVLTAHINERGVQPAVERFVIKVTGDVVEAVLEAFPLRDIHPACLALDGVAHPRAVRVHGNHGTGDGEDSEGLGQQARFR